MKFPRPAVVFLLIGCLAPALLAAEADLSSPKAAVKSLYNAIDSGDPAAVREVLYNPGHSALIDAYADLLVNGRKLGAAAAEKFGAAGDALGRAMLTKEDLARIDDARETVADGVTTLAIPGQGRPMSFKQLDGKWRLLLPETPAQSEAQKLRFVQGMSQAFIDATHDIEAGKFPTAAEAEQAIKDRLHGLMITQLKENPPTTRPEAPEK